MASPGYNGLMTQPTMTPIQGAIWLQWANEAANNDPNPGCNMAAPGYNGLMTQPTMTPIQGAIWLHQAIMTPIQGAIWLHQAIMTPIQGAIWLHQATMTPIQGAIWLHQATMTPILAPWIGVIVGSGHGLSPIQHQANQWWNIANWTLEEHTSLTFESKCRSQSFHARKCMNKCGLLNVNHFAQA